MSFECGFPEETRLWLRSFVPAPLRWALSPEKQYARGVARRNRLLALRERAAATSAVDHYWPTEDPLERARRIRLMARTMVNTDDPIQIEWIRRARA